MEIEVGEGVAGRQMSVVVECGRRGRWWGCWSAVCWVSADDKDGVADGSGMNEWESPRLVAVGGRDWGRWWWWERA